MLVAIGLGLIGLVLVYFEFFVPGGILGGIGGLLMIAGLVLFIFEQTHISWIFIYFFVLLFLLVGVIRLALWKIRKMKDRNTIYASKDQEGYFASSYNKDLVGKTGEALTPLRPSGYILVDHESYQAVSQSSFIKKGETIKVTGGEGSRLIVRKEEKK